jgi:tetratricopeptide (TPR) repeat protein
MSVDDVSFSLFRMIASGPGLGIGFAVAGGLAMAGLIATAWRRARPVGWGLLGVGAAVAWLGLLTVSECQTAERISAVITARSYTFADPVREAAQLGLLALPALAWGVKLVRDRLVHDRRKSLLSTYLRIAYRTYLDGNFDRAIAEYSMAIKVDPERTESYVKRGQAWWQKGDYTLAIADFDRALKIDPQLAPAYLNRGIALAARGDHEAAIADFDRASGLGPNDAGPSLHRGLSLAKLGEADRAAEEFRRVLRLTNHSDFVEPAQFHLAMIEAGRETAVAP